MVAKRKNVINVTIQNTHLKKTSLIYDYYGYILKVKPTNQSTNHHHPRAARDAMSAHSRFAKKRVALNDIPTIYTYICRERCAFFWLLCFCCAYAWRKLMNLEQWIKYRVGWANTNRLVYSLVLPADFLSRFWLSTFNHVV